MSVAACHIDLVILLLGWLVSQCLIFLILLFIRSMFSLFSSNFPGDEVPLFILTLFEVVLNILQLDCFMMISEFFDFLTGGFDSIARSVVRWNY